MKTKEKTQVITFTSAASATTTVHTALFTGAIFTAAEGIVWDATITGGTGGTTDVYLQRKLDTNLWADFIHFPQVAAGVTKKYTVSTIGNGATIVEVGGGTDAAPGVALAANTAVDVVPGGDVRIVVVTGAGTSVGATQTIRAVAYSERF